MLKVVKGKDQIGTYDEKKRIIRVRNREISIPVNAVISTGDSVDISGERYDILDFNPSWYVEIAKRGAQVIHPKDAAYIISRCGIACGSRVLEAGVGSGALTSSILWSVGQDGRLYSMEMEETAISNALENVESMIDTGSWEILRGDVRSSEIPDRLDSAVLDIPDPWNALENVIPSLRPGGIICTYSPTYNQVDQTVEKMRSLDLSVIETVEIMRRNILVRPDATRPDHRMLGHTAFLTFASRKSGHSLRL